MKKEHKPLFEIINTFWVLLKPYAKGDDEKSYKKIMSDMFNMLIKDRGDKFTDDWYKSTKEIIDYPDNFKGTAYCEFATELAMAMLDYWTCEYRQTANGKAVTYHDFAQYISRPFINEWEKKRESENSP